MHICQKRGFHLNPQLFLVVETKFLEVIFDRRLSFVPHLKYVKKKDLKVMTKNVIGNTEWGADRKVMFRPYRSLVRFKLDYGCTVYESARKTYLQMLDPVQNLGLRLCLGAFRTSPVESLYVDAHEPSSRARRAKLSLQYASKIKSVPKHPARDAVFNNKYMKLFHARPNAIRPLAFALNSFELLSTLSFQTFLKHLHILCHHLGIWDN